MFRTIIFDLFLLSTLARFIFHKDDDPLLKYEYDDNKKIEPVFYAPVIPMVLVNGADGIGTGWMTKIPNFDPREIIKNLQRMMDGDEPIPMVIIFFLPSLKLNIYVVLVFNLYLIFLLLETLLQKLPWNY